MNYPFCGVSAVQWRWGGKRSREPAKNQRTNTIKVGAASRKQVIDLTSQQRCFVVVCAADNGWMCLCRNICPLFTRAIGQIVKEGGGGRSDQSQTNTEGPLPVETVSAEETKEHVRGEINKLIFILSPAFALHLFNDTQCNLSPDKKAGQSIIRYQWVVVRWQLLIIGSQAGRKGDREREAIPWCFQCNGYFVVEAEGQPWGSWLSWNNNNKQSYTCVRGQRAARIGPPNFVLICTHTSRRRDFREFIKLLSGLLSLSSAKQTGSYHYQLSPHRCRRRHKQSMMIIKVCHLKQPRQQYDIADFFSPLKSERAD